MVYWFVVPAPDLPSPGDGRTGVAPEMILAVDFFAMFFLLYGEYFCNLVPKDFTVSFLADLPPLAPPTTLALEVGSCFFGEAPLSYLKIVAIATVCVFPSLNDQAEKDPPEAKLTTFAEVFPFFPISGKLSPLIPLLTAAERQTWVYEEIKFLISSSLYRFTGYLLSSTFSLRTGWKDFTISLISMPPYEVKTSDEFTLAISKDQSVMRITF